MSLQYFESYIDELLLYTDMEFSIQLYYSKLI